METLVFLRHSRASGAHLKELHIINTLLSPAPLVHCTPITDDPLYILDRESCKGEVVAGMEDNNVTSSIHRLGLKQWVRCRRGRWTGRGKNGSIVVFKDVCVFVRLRLLTTRAIVSRAEITLRIVLREFHDLGRLDLAQPRPLRAVWRDEHVLSREWVNCESVSCDRRCFGCAYVCGGGVRRGQTGCPPWLWLACDGWEMVVEDKAAKMEAIVEVMKDSSANPRSLEAICFDVVRTIPIPAHTVHPCRLDQARK